MAFVGIGTPSHGSSAAILDSLDLTERKPRSSGAAEPVGDIAARYYDEDGHPMQRRRSTTGSWGSPSTTW